MHLICSVSRDGLRAGWGHSRPQNLVGSTHNQQQTVWAAGSPYRTEYYLYATLPPNPLWLSISDPVCTEPNSQKKYEKVAEWRSLAPAASELVGDELDNDHELRLWANEFYKDRRKCRMQLLKLATAACNAIAIAEMGSIAAANGIGMLHDYGCIGGMNGAYPGWGGLADMRKETSHEDAPPIVIVRELLLWGPAGQTDSELEQEQSESQQRQRDKCAVEQPMLAAEVESIGAANDIGIPHDYDCIDGMNGEYPAWESQADWHKETSHENAPPIVTERELLLWGVADQTSCELGQEQSESEQRQRDKCAIEQSMVAAELEAEGYGIFYDYGCIDGMNGEYPAWESQSDWHKDTSHENGPPIVIARELLLWGCAKSAGDVDAEQCANYLADQEGYMALHIAHNMAEPPEVFGGATCGTSMAIRHPALLPPVAHNLVVATTSTTTRSCNCGVLCCRAPSCISKRRTNMHGNG